MRSGTLIQLCAGRYYQGSGVLSHLGEDAALLGTRVWILADCQVWPKVEQAVTDLLARHGITGQRRRPVGLLARTPSSAWAAAGLLTPPRSPPT